jgi:hypothetical protein
MIRKLDDFNVGYRKGVVFAINCLINLLGNNKIRNDEITIPLKVYLQAILDKLDLFIDYGDTICFAYSNHDKKGKPQKAEIFKDINHFKRTQKVKLLIDVVQMAIETKDKDFL